MASYESEYEAGPDAREATTHFEVECYFAYDDGEKRSPLASVVKFNLETGRTHQIRVHADVCHFPLIGDPVYGKPSPQVEKAAKYLDASCWKPLKNFSRQALHARAITYRHPETGAEMHFEVPMPADMERLLGKLKTHAVSR